ncbi:MAG: 50S ribosomal protein L10 [Deltaproteobacteria bacterium]
MNLQEKTETVEGLKDRFSRATVTLLAEPRGLSVASVSDLRNKVRALDGEYKIAKNSLAKLAIADTPSAALADQLKGQTALVFGYGDPIAVLKEIVDYIKENEDKMDVRAAVLDGDLYDEAGVRKLSKLGSLNEVRGQFLRILSAPGTQLVRLISEPGGQIARVLQARADAGAAGE